MKCPICSVDLVMSERQGVEVDYCPKCRGVWLDRGELDKIVERGLTTETQHSDFTDPIRERWRGRPRDDDDDDHRAGQRRGGFLSDLFDF
jgi:Zn-finger nucleic acid-binding protein